MLFSKRYFKANWIIG